MSVAFGKQSCQRLPDLLSALQPIGERPLQPAFATHGIPGAGLLGNRSRSDVQRNAEIAILEANVRQWHRAGEAGNIGEITIGGDDALDMGISEKALRALPRDFVDGVDEQNLVASLLRLY